MGLGLQPVVARATYPLNCIVARLLPQRRRVVVLTYHRIGTREQLWPEPFELAECTAEQFEREMAWVRRYCTPIDMEALEQIVHRGRPCPSRAVLVTFDDGYREDLLRALPALRRHGIRPTVFLATDLIDSDRRFWWDRVGVCLETTARHRARSAGEPEVDLPLSTRAERDLAIAVVMALAKPLPGAARDHFITRLERDLEVAPSDRSPRRLVLGWEEIRALAAEVDFGAHTLSHPVLSSLTRQEAHVELARSRAIVEERLERPCTTVAIPYGGGDDYNEQTLAAAAEAGFRTIFSLENTLRPPVFDADRALALVDRVSLSMAAGAEGVAAKITWPGVFVPDWTGRIQRALASLRPGR